MARLFAEDPRRHVALRLPAHPLPACSPATMPRLSGSDDPSRFGVALRGPLIARCVGLRLLTDHLHTIRCHLAAKAARLHQSC
jgi:hypothetical protein